MSKKLDAGNVGAAATGNDRLRLFEPPGTVESFQVANAGNSNGSAEGRLKSEGTIPMLSEQMRRSTNGRKTLDLRSHCPVCGNPYHSGEAVLALASLSFAKCAVPS